MLPKIWVRHPEKGGQMIAGKLIHAGSVNGSYVWFDWIPRTPGEHRIYAKVLERRGDAKKGNNVASMTVRVVPADRRPPRLAVKLSPDTLLWPPDGRMVPVRAEITVSDDQDSQPDIRLEAITHNEANDASQDVKGAEFGTDDRRFRLRAELSGNDSGTRAYEVVYSATDWAGNKTFARAYVIVPRNRGGGR